MKAIVLLVTACLFSSASVMASSAIDFGVTGKITPGACYPTLSNSTVDFGEIKVTELERHTATVIDRNRVNTLNISCDAATLFGVRGVDDRAGSVGNNWYRAAYGLGLTSRGEKIGAHYVEVHPDRSTINGTSAFTTYSDARGQQWGGAQDEPSAIPNDGQLLGFTDAYGSVDGPVPIKDASFGLNHFLVIAPASELTLTGEVQLDGKATIELIYL